MDQNPHLSDSEVYTLPTTSVFQTNLIRIISGISQKYEFLQLFLGVLIEGPEISAFNKDPTELWPSGKFRCVGMFLPPASTLSTTQPSLTKHQNTFIEHCSTWVNPLDARNNPMAWVLQLPSFFFFPEKGDGGTESLRSMHKITELVTEESGIWTWNCNQYMILPRPTCPICPQSVGPTFPFGHSFSLLLLKFNVYGCWTTQER